MIAPTDVAWRGDVGVTYADPDEVLDPNAFSVAFPLYSVDSELSTEASNRGWSCRLLSCVPPLGLVSASLGLQLGAGFLLFAAATNGQRLHGLTPSVLDPELPSIYTYVLERDPKTYAWCLAYVLSALLIVFALAAAVAAAVAVCLACCTWARALRGLGIIQALICTAAAVSCGAWLCGYAVSQSTLSSITAANFMKPFNYGTLLFAKTHEHMLRAAGTMAAAGAAASARTSRATCQDTAVGATTTCYALLLTWASAFVLMHTALGGMGPPVFGLPAVLISFALLMHLNFGFCERWKHALSTLLFVSALLVAVIAWSAAQEMYTINYTNRKHSATALVKQLKKLINLSQWGRAFGGRLGVATFVALAAANVTCCLFAGMVMFYRAFGHRIEAFKRKRRQKKRDKKICEEVHERARCGPSPVVATYASPVVRSPSPPPPPRKILVPPPPHMIFP